ncbi:MAG: Calx-beta domain-containing protein [Planctomycetaceae bacterium]
MNATILDGQGEGTILDNDPAPDLVLIRLFSPEYEGGVGEIEVSLTSPSSEDITVTLGTTDGTALAGTDYIAPNSQVTIPAGSLVGSTFYEIDLLVDNLYEGAVPRNADRFRGQRGCRHSRRFIGDGSSGNPGRGSDS